MNRPISLQSALMLSRAQRRSGEVGRFHITITEKRKGDWVFNPRTQEWEKVQ